jgi:RHS repeat-associated protein
MDTETLITTTTTPQPTQTPSPVPTATITPQNGHVVYVYDGDGNLVKSVIGDVVTYYPNGSYELKVSGSNEVITKYYSVGSSRIAYRINGTITWLLNDHLGSTVGTVDENGELISVLKYTAYGELRTGSSTTDYRYTGQREETEIGLYYYVARMYDPYLNRFLSPDTIVPDPGQATSFDRYAYSNNNPINYNDFSGHSAGWFGNFIYGFSAEFVRTNNWIGAITAPTVAQALAPSSYESNAMLAGRIVADLTTLAIGVTEIIGGGTIAGGGAVVGCGTTLCLASAPAVAAGVAVIGAGVMTTTSGSVGLGENLALFSKRNDKNQEALIDIAQDAKQKGGVTEEQAQTLLDWAEEYDVLPHSSGIEQHLNRNFNVPHIRIGPINHIPLLPE